MMEIQDWTRVTSGVGRAHRSALDGWLSTALVIGAVGLMGVTLAPVFLSPRSAAGERAASTGDATGEAPPAHPDRVVVLELFTSQGCSSCPPADRLLSRLGRDPELGERVAPLSFHVDYWNRLGWRDPFSSPEWSERQERYARALRARSVYTPQLVVDGKREMVGSNEGLVLDAIHHSLAEPPVGRLAVEVGAPEDGALPVSVTAELEDGAGHAPPLDLMLALFQTGLETEVPRGENAGRHLANDYVVRRLTRVTELSPETPRVEQSLRLPVDPEWGAGDLGVAAFLQNPKKLTIGAAAVGRVAATTPN
jgi:hypothetical protein